MSTYTNEVGTVEANTERANDLIAFQERWLEGAYVSPLMSERWHNRANALARRLDECPRRFRRYLRGAAKANIAARKLLNAE